MHPARYLLSRPVLSTALALAAVVFSACGSESQADSATQASAVSPTPTPAALVDRVRAITVAPNLVHGRVAGSPDAPVKLVVFEDFRCSHCLDFTANVEPIVLDRYVASGRVSLEVRHFPILGQASAVAAVAAQCALRQDAFWPYHKALFAEQAARGQFTMERFTAIAGGLGLDEGAFKTCLEGLETLPEVEKDYDEARSTGFTGTPSVLLNGAPQVNPANVDGWTAMLDAALKR